MDVQSGKLLIIDDCPGYSDSLYDLLHGLPVEVRTAASGAGGVRLAREWLPDMVICELRMAPPDGLDVVRALQAVPGLGGSTLIAVSGDVTAKDEAAARAAGFHHVWEKAHNLTRLLGLAAQL